MPVTLPSRAERRWVTFRSTPTPARPDFDKARLAWLQQSVQANRFLPEPTIDSIFVGDGDYRAIGAEFLGHLVRLGGILPALR